MSSIERYIEKCVTEFKARPILPFGAPLRVGAIGVLDKGGQWSPRGTVASVLNARVGKVDTGRRANWQATSGDDVKLSFLGSGKASTMFPQAPKAGAKIEVSFGSSESLLVGVDRLKVSTMRDPGALLAKMLKAYDRGTWQKDYVLVYEVIEPAEVLVVLSKSNDSKFLLSAKASVKAPQGTADLAGKFKMSFQSKDAVKLDSGRQPLFFNGYRVKEDVWTGNIGVTPLGADSATASIFERV